MRVTDQNGVSQAWCIVEIHLSGRGDNHHNSMWTANNISNISEAGYYNIGQYSVSIMSVSQKLVSELLAS